MKTLILILLAVACASKKPEPKPVVIKTPPPAPAPKIGEKRMVDAFGTNTKKGYKIVSMCANSNRENSLILTMKPTNGRGQPLKMLEDGDTTGIEKCK